ncbi:MAG: leucyl aminopeptidase [Candidatus Krumholzibacteria bacterium]|nr:leucyl aminopeptidase [Candidatus Krumholzibacteria bacterium]
MIKSVVVRSGEINGKEEVVVLPVAQKTRKLQGPARALDRACNLLLSHYLKKGLFDGDTGATVLIGLGMTRTPSHVLLMGVGDPDKLTAETAAETAGAASKVLSKHKFRSAALLVGNLLDERFVRAFVKGFALAQYQFSLNEKPAKPDSLKRLSILADGHRTRLSRAARSALVVAEYTARVRDMVNSPANLLTPSILSDEAKAVAKEHGLFCRVITPAEMKKSKMGAILGVAEGSREQPRLIVMEYNKAKKNLPQVCLVGKGVTFDSGGISLKHWEGMSEMKGDMAGAAVVINAIAAASRLDIPLRIVAVVPAVENMPDGTALRPGDVVTTFSGKTIEVLSTDAEGRLILADAITYVRKHYDPKVTVDFATLTGAVLIALGTRIAGVMGNDQAEIDRLIAAGEKAGELAWQLPITDHFRKAIKGDITDYKNYSGRNGSTIMAAALLSEFAGDAPWMHVDIAGTFWNGGHGASYHTKGATGYGLDLALQYLQDLADNS